VQSIHAVHINKHHNLKKRGL